jgi:hypothetical protein
MIDIIDEKKEKEDEATQDYELRKKAFLFVTNKQRIERTSAKA